MRRGDFRSDSLTWWKKQYYKFEVITTSGSHRVQRRAIGLFIAFRLQLVGNDKRVSWSPCLPGIFQQYLWTVIDKRNRGGVFYFSKVPGKNRALMNAEIFKEERKQIF